ncbi:MAG: histidine kinase [Bacteroidota bacterium]
MKKAKQLPSKVTSDYKRQVILVVGIALPIYFIADFYTKTVVPNDDEQAALAATFLFLGGLYVGRYLSQLWASKTISQHLLVGLCLVSVACIVWLFVHAEFPLKRRVALNLLLFYLPLLILSLAVGMLVKMSRMTVNSQVQEANARAEQSRSELHLLQSQLSPHFLFNTLNNMYGLSLVQSEKIPTLLLKLSELLRYSVYETKELFVPLKNELAYLSHYIDFEKIRIGDRLNLTTSIEEVSQSDIKIAPMLLIVFVENAFKHSKNTTEQTISIDMSLKTWGNSILFSVKNSQGVAPDENMALEKGHGLGLVNVRKRLELLYLHAYDLAIHDEADFYEVMLQIKVK